MKERLITFETAKLAKEKNYYNGEEGDCYRQDSVFFDNFLICNYYPAPTQSLLQKWLRENHNIHIIVHPHFDNFGEHSGWECIKVESLIDSNINTIIRSGHETYEDALECGLLNALSLI
jgi:hypothetical protein